MYSVRLLTQAGRCLVSFSMQPRADRDYEAVVSWGEKQCFVNVKELRTDAATSNVAADASPVASQMPTCNKGFN